MTLCMSSRGLERSDRSDNPHVLTMQGRIPSPSGRALNLRDTLETLPEILKAGDDIGRPLMPCADTAVVVPVPGWFHQRTRIGRMYVDRAFLRLGMWELQMALSWNRAARKRLERRIEACH